MKKLKEEFRRKGVEYRLLERQADVALFKLFNSGTDHEVCRIYTGQHPMADEPSERIPSDEQFGADGSKSFYSYGDAKVYFDVFVPVRERSLKNRAIVKATEGSMGELTPNG